MSIHFIYVHLVLTGACEVSTTVNPFYRLKKQAVAGAEEPSLDTSHMAVEPTFVITALYLNEALWRV